jgi:hypothetical protein
MTSVCASATFLVRKNGVSLSAMEGDNMKQTIKELKEEISTLEMKVDFLVELLTDSQLDDYAKFCDDNNI